MWKLIPILQRHRPDLKIEVLDCRPTGLVLISNLDPGNTALQDSYADILQEWTELDLETYGVERFFDAWDYVDARAMAQDGFPLFQAVALDETSIAQPSFVSP